MASGVKLVTPSGKIEPVELDLRALRATPSQFSFEHLVAQNRRLHGIDVDMSTQLLVDESGKVCGGLKPLVIFSGAENNRTVHFASPSLRDLFAKRTAEMNLSGDELAKLAEDISRAARLRLLVQNWVTYKFQDQRPARLVNGVTIENHKTIKYYDFDRAAVRRLKSPIFSKYEGSVQSSVAFSVSENGDAADVRVDTIERFRGRGHAPDVVGSWLGHVTSAGKQAFYSHNSANTASSRVAAKLGFGKIFDDIRILELGHPGEAPQVSG